VEAGGVVEEFLQALEAIDPELGDAWPEAVAALREATTWILTNGTTDPSDALAAATPYLRMFGLVAGGWVMARQAIEARRLGDHAKLATARFYADNILVQSEGLAAQVLRGGPTVLGLPADLF